MELALAGAITGKAKTVLPGKMVTSFVMGSRALYEWVHDNPAIELRPSDFTNDPWTIARNDRMVAINSALAVDLTGQVAADTLSGKFFSGIGGQVDFVRGAARSRGGRSIIALPSTAKSGSISRIQAALEPGTGVVTSRGDVRYVVTEYGVADLWGKNIRERATALIAIAHPDYRRELTDAGKQRRYLFPDQVVPRAIYPWQEERSVTLPDGAVISIRPVRITDEEALQDHLYSLSDDSIYRRYLSFKKSHPHEEIQDLVDVDYHDNMALVALDEHDQIVGLTRYDLDPATGLAEVAFSVPDAVQGRGVGTALLRRAAEVAYSRGIAGFFADVLASNTPMLRVFHRSGHRVTSNLDHGTYYIELMFDPDKLGERGLEPPALRPSMRPAPR
jgi:GNAT superfamily N-acetyltransferase